MDAVVAGVLFAIVGAVINHRRLARRLRAAAVGESFEVPVKLRLLDHRGWRRRWREGFLSRQGPALTFRQRRPRVGPELDLSFAAVTGSRKARFVEQLWFSGKTVLYAGDPLLGALEIAAGTDEDLSLGAVLLRDQPTIEGWATTP